jgi:integrase
MSALSHAAAEYLELRRLLGHGLADAHRLLPRFVAYLDATGATRVTVAAALAWAQQPDADPTSTVWPRRMTVARGFARYMAGIDGCSEVPPPGLIRSQQRRRSPFILSSSEVAMVMAAARAMKQRLPAATQETLIGLLAATGMRVGEALRLDRGDVDWAEGVLLIRESKFGKSRQIPVLPSTLSALDRYGAVRDQHCERPSTRALFVSLRGTRVIYQTVQAIFRRLCDGCGIGADAPSRPRLHDLRHRFAVATLLGWYRAGEDVEARIPLLSTYLGHREPRNTYWYLSAVPELLALAAGRLELSRGVISR